MNKRPWTSEEDEILIRLYNDPTIFAKHIAKLTNHCTSSVYSRAKKLGLKKPEIFRSIAGKIGTQSAASIAHRFRPGQVPYNKGKKMSAEMYEKAKGTMFKKGQKPANYKPIGSERINVDGYVEVKVADPGIWELKHRVIWEKANGPIPKGYNIQFRNRNSQDVRLENLYMISKADQVRTENSLIARYPKELQEVIRLKGTLKRQLTMIKKNSKIKIFKDG